MATSTVVSMLAILLFVLLAATATAAAAAQTDVAIDEAYAHLVNVTGDQEHWAERAEEARAYNRAEYMSDPVAVMDRFEDAGDRTAAVRHQSPSSLPRKFGAGARPPTPSTGDDSAAAATVQSPSSLPRKFRAGARPPTPSTSAAGAVAAGPGTGSAWPGAPSASSSTTPPASSPTDRGNLQHAVVEDSSLWITFARDMI